MGMSAAAPSSPFLALPRELRDEIFAHLARPEHVFSSNPKAEDQSFHRSTKIRETYIDSRIYLPVRPSANVLQSCKQLREECLDYFAHRYIALLSKTNTGASPLGDAASKTVAANSSSEYERRVERSIDDGLVRITLVLMRSVQSTMGSFFPERKELSPRFLAMKPLLGRVSKIKLLVWAGYEWWRAARPRDMGPVRIRKTQFKRTSADHDDEVQQSTQWEGGSTETPKSEPQNKLSIAVATILQHLPNIEELEIDVRIHAAEYWNWDLPDDRWEYLSGWLQSPLHFEDQCRLKKVKRNLICQWEPPHSFMFFRQIEARPEGGKSWHFERGYRSVPMDLEEQNSYPAEPPLTESFDRSK